MTVDFSKIDRLVSDFESGLSVDTLLAELNDDKELGWELGYELFDFDFYFVVHESSVFVTDDDIEDYFETSFLLQLRDDQILEFVNSQIESCIDGGDVPAVNFCDIGGSCISAIGEVRGQAGIEFVDIDITKTRSDRFKKLLDQGCLFLPTEHFVIDENLLIEKYQKFIRNRLNQGTK